MNPRHLNITQSVSRFSETVIIAKRASVLGILLVLSVGAVTISYELGLLDSLLNSLSFFQIQSVNVHVQAPLDEAMVKSWLPKVSDKTLLGLRVKPISELLLAKPWVETVAIRKVFPETLEINISTKQPMALGIIKGEGYFFDDEGRVIEKSSPQTWAAPLPIVTRAENSDWDAPLWSSIVRKLPESIMPAVSEIAFDRYPYFRIFINSPHWEVSLSIENWESQAPYLTHLIQNASSHLPRARKINLILSKKAVVSNTFSK